MNGEKHWVKETCFKDKITGGGYTYSGDKVCVHKNIVTSQGPGELQKSNASMQDRFLRTDILGPENQNPNLGRKLPKNEHLFIITLTILLLIFQWRIKDFAMGAGLSHRK